MLKNLFKTLIITVCIWQGISVNDGIQAKSQKNKQQEAPANCNIDDRGSSC